MSKVDRSEQPKLRSYHLSRFAQSNLSASAYSDKHGIPRSTFYSWQRQSRLKEERRVAASSSDFVEYSLLPSPTSFSVPPLELSYNGISIRIDSDCSSESFSALLSTLKEVLQ